MRARSGVSLQLSIVIAIVIGIYGISGGQGVVVTPARLEAHASIDGVLPPVWVENRGSQPVSVQLSTGWGTHDPNGNPIYFPAEVRPDVTLHVSPLKQLLPPGTRMAIHLRVEPAGIPAYPVLFIALSSTEQGQLSLTRVAVPILVASGEEEPHLRMESVSVEHVGQDRYILHTLVVNDGREHTRTRGALQVVRSNGAVAVEAAIPELLVLPGASRRVSVPWDGDELEAGEYRVVLQTEPEMDIPRPIRFAVGPDRRIEWLEGSVTTVLALGDTAP